MKTEQEVLAENLCKIHGAGTIRHERSGAQLYVACPSCLQNYGDRELTSRHLVINLDFWLMQEFIENRKKKLAICMKCNTKYSKDQLTKMAPLKTRLGRFIKTDVSSYTSNQNAQILDTDENGNLVPFGPGKIIPIIDLATTHPARWYIEQRGFDVNQLYAQFQTSFCEQETPPDKAKSIGYKRLSGTWRDTPQGRIIFFCFMYGIRKGWQGRLMEHSEGEFTYLWHPYNQEWETSIDKKELSKYVNGRGTKRSEILYGFQYVKDYLETLPAKDRYVVITEGCLDAAKFDKHGLALTGKSISQIHIDTLKGITNNIIIGSDGDQVGIEASKIMIKKLIENDFKVEIIYPLKGYKDFGEMGYDICANMAFEAFSKL